MTWLDLLNAQRVRAHRTSPREIHDLRDDRRFATAYNALLQLTKIVIACEGYRVVDLDHHQTTFQALELAMGAAVIPMSSYF